ncbi:putative membrane protein [Moraxella catarrhalis]|uniref:Membrane protein n=1 Tax=Moraxella catarrhalis TaxID=480 RepID=A0ABY0BJ70_MORCA|nr:putative membrane protein [Moraxella catarrhalis]RUO15960.1 putative membrane protein [Moraxella catarrhalis]
MLDTGWYLVIFCVYLSLFRVIFLCRVQKMGAYSQESQ